MCLVDTSQMLHDCKAIVSLDSVVTTVVIASTSVLSSGSCISSTVALMCMDVEFGERVVLVRKTVLLQCCGQMDVWVD